MREAREAAQRRLNGDDDSDDDDDNGSCGTSDTFRDAFREQVVAQQPEVQTVARAETTVDWLTQEMSGRYVTDYLALHEFKGTDAFYRCPCAKNNKTSRDDHQMDWMGLDGNFGNCCLGGRYQRIGDLMKHIDHFENTASVVGMFHRLTKWYLIAVYGTVATGFPEQYGMTLPRPPPPLPKAVTPRPPVAVSGRTHGLPQGLPPEGWSRKKGKFGDERSDGCN